MTGLYNYGYRDYSPQVVRFTTVDPIRDGSNWFAYVNNDPANFKDEFGLNDYDAYVKQQTPAAFAGQQGLDTSKFNMFPSLTQPSNSSSPTLSRDRDGEKKESERYGVKPDPGGVESINMAGAGAVARGFFVNGISGVVASLGNFGTAETIANVTQQLLRDKDPVGAGITVGTNIAGTLFGNFVSSNQTIMNMKKDSINSSLNFGITNTVTDALSDIANSYK